MVTVGIRFVRRYWFRDIMARWDRRLAKYGTIRQQSSTGVIAAVTFRYADIQYNGGNNIVDSHDGAFVALSLRHCICQPSRHHR